ncbi:MAG: DUF3604 domain-containing protein [Candidatus Binatia bacterium]|nr:DUF3604 domain-containing protein [Candidatus Binatia bacterium]
MNNRRKGLLTILLLFVLSSSATAVEQCSENQPERQVFWGDLHVHTAVSMDANMFGTRVRPDEAYKFAKGGAIQLDPRMPEVKLERPLDFAAVTDHASNFGSVHLCTTPTSEVYDSEQCKAYREPYDMNRGSLRQTVRDLFERIGGSLSSPAVCGEDGARCTQGASTVWKETQDAAARHDDPAPSCKFTTFVAYEYTATPELTKVHRNVIFRNDKVLDLPISYADEPDAIKMWKRLRAECIEAGTGCDVLAIPHNSNLSNGNMFAIDYGDAKTKEEQAEIAKLRASMEPLVEVMQMKGDSECRNGMWNVVGADELCDFEKMRPKDTPDCEDGTGKGALAGDGCVSRRDFVRYALTEGLAEADRIGVNPYAFGLIAATDIHDGTPGTVEESRLDLRMSRPSGQPGMNPGGIAAVWAEENSRESLFRAMRRRETYGTSGPRMSVRFFGGWDYPKELCKDAALVKKGYAGGVPMGSDLPPAPKAAKAPGFVVSALRDPGTDEHPGGKLQLIQIIKGWMGDDGKVHQRVFDVAGRPKNGAKVDTATCNPIGTGADSLCRVWVDPIFDPKKRAVYYARVVENPSCRQTGWACKAAPRDAKPAWCTDGSVSLTTQERAWTSAIWYAPTG